MLESSGGCRCHICTPYPGTSLSPDSAGTSAWIQVQLPGEFVSSPIRKPLPLDAASPCALCYLTCGHLPAQPSPGTAGRSLQWQVSHCPPITSLHAPEAGFHQSLLEPPGSRAKQSQSYLSRWDTDHGDRAVHHVPVLARDRLVLTAESQSQVLRSRPEQCWRTSWPGSRPAQGTGTPELS